MLERQLLAGEDRAADAQALLKRLTPQVTQKLQRARTLEVYFTSEYQPELERLMRDVEELNRILRTIAIEQTGTVTPLRRP